MRFTVDNHASLFARGKAIAYNTHEISRGGLWNKGAISNFDSDAMVEVPCVVGSNGPEAMCQGEIPTFECGIMRSSWSREACGRGLCREELLKAVAG